MDSFSRLHPSVLFLYFTMSLAAVLTFNNPVISAVSLFCVSAYFFAREGRYAVKRLGFSAAVIIAVSLFNMLFAHYGEDVLFTLGKTEFTLEALFYGFNQGMVLAASLLWFTALGLCVDTEKTVYIFRFAPKLSLMISMIIGFIPRFINKQKDIREARLAINGGRAPKGIKSKFSVAADDLSALTSYVLEGSIITANSMTARAYNPSVIRKGKYRLKTADYVWTAVTVSLFSFVLFQKIIGNLSFVFEPQIYIKRLSIPAVICYMLFGIIPVIIDVKEILRWKLSRSAI